MTLRLSIIIPSYNESENLEHLFEKLSRSFSQSDSIDIIIVDNGSTDNTPNVLKGLIDTCSLPLIKSVRVENNQGYGYGILSGLKAATGEVLAWTHADLQTDPKDVLSAFDRYKEDGGNQTIVKGRRQNRPLFDTLFTWGMQVYSSLILKQPLVDINAQPKLFSRTFYERYLKDNAPHDFSLDLYLLYCAKKDKYKIIEVPVRFDKRLYGEAKGGGSFKTKLKLIRRTFAYIHELKKGLSNRDS